MSDEARKIVAQIREVVREKPTAMNASQVTDSGAIAEAAKWLHAAYDRPPQTPECKAMLARIDAALALQAIHGAESGTISIQEAWEVAGGNPGIKATREDLLIALRDLDAVADEVPPKSQAVTLSDEQRDTLQSALVALDPESICAANVRKWLAVDEIEHGVVVTNADESAKPPIFKEWFDREWDAFADKGWGDKIQSMAWAMKAYRAFSEPASAASKAEGQS